MKQETKHSGFMVLICSMMLFIGIEMGGFQSVLESAGQTFLISRTGMGFLVAAQSAAMIIAPMIFGNLADRCGKKFVIVCGTVFMVVGAALAGLAANAWMYAIGAFFLGAGVITTESTSFAAISDYYPRESSRLITMALFFVSTGAIFGPMVLQACMDHFGVGWQSLFLVVFCAFAVFSFLVGFFKMKKNVVPKELRDQRVRPLAFLRSRAYRILIVTTVLLIGVDHSIGSFVNTLMSTQLQAAHLGTYAVSAFWLGTALSRLVNSIKSLPPTKTMVVYHIFLAATALGLALAPHAYVAIGLSCLVGFSVGPLWSTVCAMAAREFPEQSGGATGLAGTANGIGGMIYPVAVGVLSDAVNVRAAFLMLAFTALICVCLSVRYQKVSDK